MPLTNGSIYNVKDYLLSIDDLNRPRVLDMMNVTNGKINSAIIMIARLLLLKKATYADQPDLGIDIRGRYRFTFADELNELQYDIEQQISTYLPEFLPINVNCKYERINNINCVVIYMIIQQMVCQLVYNTEDLTLEGFEDMLKGNV